MAAKRDESRSFDLKQYSFQTEQIPRLSITDPEAERRISEAVIYVINVHI